GMGVLSLVGPMMFQFLNLKIGSPVVSPLIVVVSVVLGVGVTVFAGLAPAIRASRVTPLEALRPSSVDLEFTRGAGRWFALGVALIVAAVLALFSGQLALIAPGGIMFLVGIVLVVPGLVR